MAIARASRAQNAARAACRWRLFRGAADKGSTNEEIARNISIGTSAVYRAKPRFVEDRLERVLNEAPRPRQQMECSYGSQPRALPEQPRPLRRGLSDVRSPAWLMVVACSAAHADDGAATHPDDGTEISLRASPRLELPDGPLLQHDWAPRWQAAGAAVDHEARIVDLGRGVRLAAEGKWWTTEPLSPLSGLDGNQHAWRTAYELSYDLGPFRLGAHVGAGQLDGRFERGSYRFAGMTVTRTLRLSPWMLAWISLSAGLEQWSGLPAPARASSTEVKLTVGTTFR